MKKAPEGGIIRISYEVPYYMIRIKTKVSVNEKKAIMNEKIEFYKTKKLKKKLITRRLKPEKKDREEVFPCINEERGPVKFTADYANNTLNLEIMISQENGPCWIHERAQKKLERILGIKLKEEENKLIGNDIYIILTQYDKEGNMKLKENTIMKIGPRDLHPPEYYQLFLTIMKAWEYTRRHVKTAI